ncbi:hypothetical protein EV401DRAFT_1883770 [Pisolithus croceorrhizus]|nr:hypothetical protein EV401DRAFT_1883770 [Pisolithus croceorrhizus]
MSLLLDGDGTIALRNPSPVNSSEHDACRKKLTIAVIALRAYSGIWSSASLDSRFRDREGGTTEERHVILNLMRNREVCTRGADERGFSCTDGKGDAEALAYAPERETDSYHGLVAGTCRFGGQHPPVQMQGLESEHGYVELTSNNLDIEVGPGGDTAKKDEENSLKRTSDAPDESGHETTISGSDNSDKDAGKQSEKLQNAAEHISACAEMREDKDMPREALDDVHRQKGCWRHNVNMNMSNQTRRPGGQEEVQEAFGDVKDKWKR